MGYHRYGEPLEGKIIYDISNCFHVCMSTDFILFIIEPVREKTNNLHGRKQRRRSASR